jgi:hypothetical protein
MLGFISDTFRFEYCSSKRDIKLIQINEGLPGNGFIDNLQSDLKTRKQSFCISAARRAAVKGLGSMLADFSSTTLSESSKTMGRIRSKLEMTESSFSF